MSPVELSPASRTFSSSSTLWAQPSKEWVIPAKPKPGRKPTKTGAPIPMDDLDEVSSGSRRMQNRAAQRAFRERKQTQLAELQARLHSYEQGEIERNVALQTIAKRTKEENEELRKENQALKEKIAQLEKERDEDKKRTYDDPSTSSLGFPQTNNTATKRARVDEDGQEASSSSLFLPSSSFLSSPPGDAAADSGRHESYSRQAVFPTPPPIRDLATLTCNGHDIVGPFNCILCSPDAPCVCNQVTIEEAATDGNSLLHQLPRSDDLNQQSTVSLDQSVHVNTPPITSINMLDDLPAFQAPVPIRRRAGTSRTNLVFPVTPVATSSSASTCSGDPDNCRACADDNFGKAFCQAIGHSLNSSLSCVDCPKKANPADEIFVSGCCGDTGICGSCGIAPVISSTTSRGSETISTDDAWRQLKSHPNVAFGDLTLLAEVVARRSKCTGSRVIVSPALGCATPDHNPHQEPNPAKEDQSVLLSNPHELFRQKHKHGGSPPQLVPQHVLIECGRRKMREVNTDGVKEALRLLDQKFAHTR